MNFDIFIAKRKKALQKKQKEREEIILSLPGFINQLLLLMDSGLIITDAFEKIASGYDGLPAGQRNYFTDSVYRIYSESLKSGENVINGFYAFAGMSNSKELIRTGNFLYENRNRGTEIWSRLSDLSEDLWSERKRLCLEKIKKAETKMSFPLAMMLISLLIMTSAPALMQIR